MWWQDEQLILDNVHVSRFLQPVLAGCSAGLHGCTAAVSEQDVYLSHVYRTVGCNPDLSIVLIQYHGHG